MLEYLIAGDQAPSWSLPETFMQSSWISLAQRSLCRRSPPTCLRADVSCGWLRVQRPQVCSRARSFSSCPPRKEQPLPQDGKDRAAVGVSDADTCYLRTILTTTRYSRRKQPPCLSRRELACSSTSDTKSRCWPSNAVRVCPLVTQSNSRPSVRMNHREGAGGQTDWSTTGWRPIQSDHTPGHAFLRKRPAGQMESHLLWIYQLP